MTSTNTRYLLRSSSYLSSTSTNTSYSLRSFSCRSLTLTNTSYSLRSSSYVSSTSTNTSYSLRTSVTLRLRPTPGTCLDHLATSLRLRPYQLPTPTIYLTTQTTITNLHTSFVNTTNKLSSLLYCYLAFVSFIDFWLSLLARLT